MLATSASSAIPDQAHACPTVLDATVGTSPAGAAAHGRRAVGQSPVAGNSVKALATAPEPSSGRGRGPLDIADTVRVTHLTVAVRHDYDVSQGNTA